MKHKHVYIYQFELTGHGNRAMHEYSLCTNTNNPNCSDNRTLLESMLRLVYGHMPKGVKFLYEK